MDMSRLNKDEIDELERLSNLVRMGAPIDLFEAMMVIEYQESKPKLPTLWAKIKLWFARRKQEVTK